MIWRRRRCATLESWKASREAPEVRPPWCTGTWRELYTRRSRRDVGPSKDWSTAASEISFSGGYLAITVNASTEWPAGHGLEHARAACAQHAARADGTLRVPMRCVHTRCADATRPFPSRIRILDRIIGCARSDTCRHHPFANDGR